MTFRLAHDHGVTGTHVLQTHLVWLCSVASPTSIPHEHGLEHRERSGRPVRPIDTMMRRSLVVRSSGGNLKAIAQRGARGDPTALQIEVVDLDDDTSIS